ncbi:MAG: hypothetical protein WCS42_18640 [Verrucomicrobiota bacterium]
MGEFSDCFEQFPEENPANHNERGQYNPEYYLSFNASLTSFVAYVWETG